LVFEHSDMRSSGHRSYVKTVTSLFLLAMAISGCDSRSSPPVAPSVSQTATLEQKSKCTEAGWAFFQRLRERYQSAAQVDITGPLFAYNDSLGTCLCSYEIREPGSFPEKGELISVIIADVFSNREVASFHRYSKEVAWHEKDFEERYKHYMGTPPKAALLDAAIRY
jgi:hypothetical protein